MAAQLRCACFFQTSEGLRAGETAIAQMRFDEPAFLFAGDHFVIRDAAEQNTLAGGVVLDPDASARNFRRAAQREFLANVRGRRTMQESLRRRRSRAIAR